MSEPEITSDVAALTVQLLSAYLSNNTVASADLAGLIRSTREALGEDAASSAATPVAETYTPAVTARKSLASPEHIISLIDGKPYKTLKRHLTGHGLTPDEYRSRYDLPADYPMVAPAYSALRRAVANKLGLGSRRAAASELVGEAASAVPEPATSDASPVLSEPEAPVAKRGPGRRKKAAAPEQSEPEASARSTEPDVATTADDTGEPTAPKSRQPRKTQFARKAAAKSSDDAPSAAEDQADGEGPKRTRAKSTRRGKIGLFAKDDQA